MILSASSLDFLRVFTRNKERRNRFYEQFGLVFDYIDLDRQEGKSRPLLVRELRAVDTWRKNITEHRVFDYLAEVLYAKKELSMNLIANERGRQSLISERKAAEQRPMRWALKQTYDKWKFPATMIFVLVLGFFLYKLIN